MHKQNFNDAITAFNRALQIDPQYTEALYGRGYAYELSGNLDSAKMDYLKVMKIKTNDDLAKQGMNRIDASIVTH
jgi:Flp pilus assembly protein TadD